MRNKRYFAETKEIMSSKIKECPFCGGQARIYWVDNGEPPEYTIECQCGATFSWAFTTPNNAINMWNKRC